MRRWLARLAFSFILISAVFAYEGYRFQRGDHGAGHDWRMYAFYAAAAVCFGLGLRGVRERHRLLDEQPRDPQDGQKDL